MGTKKAFENISIFDLDGCLIKSNSSFLFAKYLYKKRVISLFSICFCYFTAFLYSFKFITQLDRLHKLVFRYVLKNLEKKLLEDQAKIFWQLYFDDLVYAPAYERLKNALKERHFVAIFSSSPEYLVKEVSSYFKVPGYVASEYSADSNGYLDEITTISSVVSS